MYAYARSTNQDLGTPSIFLCGARTCTYVDQKVRGLSKTVESSFRLSIGGVIIDATQIPNHFST